MPCGGSWPRLKLTLASLECQTLAPGEAEIILVLDGPTMEEVPSAVRCRIDRLGATVLEQPQAGRAAARNRGAAHACGELLVFLDADMVAEPTLLAAHLKTQRHGPTVVHGCILDLTFCTFLDDPSVAPSPSGRTAEIPGCGSGRPPLTCEDIANDFDRQVRRRARASAMERLISDLLADDDPRTRWIGCVGANLALPRSWFEEVKGFDPGFGLEWGCEDVELGYRLTAAGRPIVCSSAATAYHLTHHRPTAGKEHGRAAAHFQAKHGHPGISVLDSFAGGKLSVSEAAMRLRTAAPGR